jgi:hypothetical protein
MDEMVPEKPGAQFHSKTGNAPERIIQRSLEHNRIHRFAQCGRNPKNSWLARINDGRVDVRGSIQKKALFNLADARFQIGLIDDTIRL